MRTNTMKLSDLLTKNDPAFFIPPYQRKYEWEEDQCAIFWQDAMEILSMGPSEDSCHFFGTVLLSVSSESSISDVRYILIDGQQRLTTAFLFLTACRDSGLCPRRLKNEIESILFRDGAPRLEQTELDFQEYSQILFSPSLTEAGGCLWKNYLFFKAEIAKWAAPQRASARIQDLAEGVLERFEIAVLEPEEKDGNLQDIFESLNSQGLPLSLADLVKNWLLMIPDASEQKRLFSSCWLPMEKSLEGDPGLDASDFIRTYMEMKACATYSKLPLSRQTKSLYQEFKRLFGDCDKPSLLEDLERHARIFAQFERAKTSDSQQNSVLLDLNIVQADAAKPFLLLLFSRRGEGKISDLDLLKVLRALRIYFLRRRLCDFAQNQEWGFPELTGKMDFLLGARDKEKAMFSLLASQDKSLRLPNDAEVEEKLKNMDFYSDNRKKKKFFLSLVEESLTHCRPNDEDENLTIEHIMPQSLNPEWREALGEDADELHSRLKNNIGNLTLAHCNLQAGNKSFEEKKAIYASQDGLQMARRCIEECKKWDESAILRREAWIADLFLNSILPVPTQYKAAENYSAENTKR